MNDCARKDCASKGKEKLKNAENARIEKVCFGKPRPKVAVIGLSGYSAFMRVKRFPQIGETAVAKDFFSEYGGKGFNQAVAIGRLGGEVKFLTAVGNDAYGRDCIEALKKESVEVFPIEKPFSTAFASILTDESGENAVTVFRGASDRLSVQDVRSFSEGICGSDVLLLQAEIPKAAIDEAMNIAKKAGVTVVYNPAPAEEVTAEQIAKADYLLPNEFEEIVLSGRGRAENLVVTLGKEGVRARIGNNSFRVKGLEVTAVDTTGAGDVFCGTFSYFLAAGDDIQTAVKKAVAASGIKVTRRGAMSAPCLEEVMQMYHKTEGTLWKN